MDLPVWHYIQTLPVQQEVKIMCMFRMYIHGSCGVAYTNRIVRFFYNTNTNRLESPVSICDTIPGSKDHNSQRMIIAPMTQGGSDYYLFYAAGDMGAGHSFLHLLI